VKHPKKTKNKTKKRLVKAPLWFIKWRY
jgi:hypothetical protein